MLIKNTTDAKAPKPIGIGNFIIMPGESVPIPDEMAYVKEFDRMGNETGRTIILPSIRLLAGLGSITFEETKKAAKAPVAAPVETVTEEAEPANEVPADKPKRGRKKAE